MYTTSVVIVQHYFDKKRPLATGITVSGSGVGTLAFGFITHKLLDSVGWQWTMRVQALCMLICIIFGAFYKPLKEALPPINTVGKEASKLLRDQSVENDYGTSISHEKEKCSANQNEKISFIESFRRFFRVPVFRNPMLYMLCASVVTFCFGLHVPYTYTPERAQKLGLSAAQSSHLISIMGISNVVSRVASGLIGESLPTLSIR